MKKVRWPDGRERVTPTHVLIWLSCLIFYYQKHLPSASRLSPISRESVSVSGTSTAQNAAAKDSPAELEALTSVIVARMGSTLQGLAPLLAHSPPTSNHCPPSSTALTIHPPQNPKSGCRLTPWVQDHTCCQPMDSLSTIRCPNAYIHMEAALAALPTLLRTTVALLEAVTTFPSATQAVKIGTHDALQALLITKLCFHLSIDHLFSRSSFAAASAGSDAPWANSSRTTGLG